MATATKKSSSRANPVSVQGAKLSKPNTPLKPAPTSKPAKLTTPRLTPSVSRKVVALPVATRPKPALATAAATPLKPTKPVARPQAAQPKSQPVAKSGRAKTSGRPAPLKSNAAAQGTLALEISPKAIRKRAPKDLAAQYGEKLKPQRASSAAPTPKATRAARKSAEERERLRQIINPSDEVLHRLARIGAIASSSEDLEDAKTRRPKSLTARRSRHWEISCGKCGAKSQFTASAGVCPRCGTIVLRD